MSPVLKPEVLAPAGSPEALRAAIGAGADAVYFGITDYNARIRARNFELGELPDVLRDLRRWGIRSCLTFNTLVFGEEERAARAVLEAIAAAGPDALIVQDLGVVRWVREIAPEIEVHASTQMTITSPDGVKLIERLGVTRVVLARELTLEEIARLRAETTMELEVFVHGALCVSYSGQCLSSEAWGGRSANRGQCAQACRHPYDLIVDGRTEDLGDRAYLLSPRDLEGYGRIPELIALGVRAFKIEGRMKSPEYVAATTSLYRAVVDRAWNAREAGSDSVGPRRIEQLAATARDVFSRGASEGFLGGVNHQILVDGRTRAHRGPRAGDVLSVERNAGGLVIVLREARPEPGRPAVELQAGDGVLFAASPREEDELGGRIQTVEPTGRTHEVRLRFVRESATRLEKIRPGTPVYRNAHPSLLADLERFAREPERFRQVAIRIVITGRSEELLRARAEDPEGRFVERSTERRLVVAESSPLSVAQAREQLARLGGTRYRLESLEADLEEGLFLPVSELNRLRRDLVVALEEERGRLHTERSMGAVHRDATVAPDSSPAAADSLRVAECLSPITWALEEIERQASGIAAGACASDSGPRQMAPTPRVDRAESFEACVSILCRTRQQAEVAVECGARGIVLDFLDLVGLKHASTSLQLAGVERTLALPRVQKPGEEKIESFFLSLEPEAILVRNLGELERLRLLFSELSNGSRRPQLLGDVSLNGVNRTSIDVLLGLGLTRITPGLDLNGEQLLSLVEQVPADRVEIPLHHRLPVFHTEHCVFAAFLSEGRDFRSCGRPCDRHRLELEDRTGQRHPVVADVGCRNTVFSAAPQSSLPYLAALRRRGVSHFRIELIDEDAEATARTLDIYRLVWNGALRVENALATLRAEGRFGVSTGSSEPGRQLDVKPVGGKKRVARVRPPRQRG